MVGFYNPPQISRDGTIEGYLEKDTPWRMLKNFFNRGGPWARDSLGYNPEVQFLVYADQMNFRASTGPHRTGPNGGQTMQNTTKKKSADYPLLWRICNIGRGHLYS